MAIHKKLLDFQKLGITVEKDADNPFFKSRYTSLNEVLDKVKKPLNDMGVVIIQRPGTEYYIHDSDDMKRSSLLNGLYTVLHDTEDDTEIESFVPFIGATDMQKLGGAISYARRYALIAMLGLEDEDKDGENVVSRAKGVDKQEKPPF